MLLSYEADIIEADRSFSRLHRAAEEIHLAKCKGCQWVVWAFGVIRGFEVFDCHLQKSTIGAGGGKPRSGLSQE